MEILYATLNSIESYTCCPDLWCRVHLVLQESQEELDLKETMAHKAHQETQEHLDHQEVLESVDLVVIQDRQDQKATL